MKKMIIPAVIAAACGIAAIAAIVAQRNRTSD